MGILNITPDSFYDGGKNLILEHLKSTLKSLMKSDIIDIGAESSRPYSKPISVNDEINRLSLLKSINFEKKILSIDSYKYETIKYCLNNGYSMINDISGGGDKYENIDLACEYDVPIVIMHMQGNPINMQDEPIYNSIIDDIKLFFEKRINYALKIGMNEKNIIVDPGIGFGKTTKDNDEIILNLSTLKEMGYPLLIGVSRKSFLSFDNDLAIDRLYATLGVSAISVMNGADILRVHDIHETKSMISIIDRIKN